MPPHLAIFDNAGAPAVTLELALSGGESSAVTTFQIWNDKGALLGDTSIARNLRLTLLAFDGTRFVPFGLPLLDERWATITVTGEINPAAAVMSHQATATLPIGTTSDIPLDDIPQNAARTIQIQVNVPGNVAATFARLKLQVLGTDGSMPLASLTILGTGSGVIPADRIASLRSLLRGSGVTANDTDTVQIERGALVFDATIVNFPHTSKTFNLNDSAAVALAAGEQYLVTLSRAADGTVTVTKGPKAELVTYPATPADHIFVSTLIVASADGATVTVAPSSVSAAAVHYAQYLVRAGVGLAVLVSPGEGVTESDRRQRDSAEGSIAVVATATNRIWLLGNGGKAVTQTDVAPEPGATLLAFAVTDGAGVTSIVDARRFTHRPATEWTLELKLRAALSTLAVPVDSVDLGLLHFDAELESVDLDLTSTDGTWTAGAMKIDLRSFAPGAAVPFPAGGAGVGGVSIYTSSGTDDRRPSIAFNAAVLRATSIDHEVRRFLAGTRFVLDVISTVTAPGAEPDQEIRVTLHMRRYR